jgi:hypothetical protein
MDLVRAKFSQRIESSNKLIVSPLMAAMFLYLCRTNKVPVMLMLHEIYRDFRIRPKNIMHMFSDANYVPPLGSSLDYIYRVSKQLGLPGNTRDHALSLLEEDIVIDNTTLIMRAYCALINAAKSGRFNMSKWKITSAFGISIVGAKMALKRLKDGSNHTR